MSARDRLAAGALVLSLAGCLFLLPGCSRGSSTVQGSSFDLAAYSVHELPIAGGAPIGKLADGSIIIVVYTRDNPDYPAGVYACSPGGKPEAVFNLAPSRTLFAAALTGDTVLWVEAGEGMIMADWHLWARDLVTDEQWEIDRGRLDPGRTPTENPTLLAPPISVSGNHVVYTVFEPGGPNGTRVALRLYDLSTGASETLDQVTDVRLDELGVPAVDGRWVVYNPGHIDQEEQARYGAIVLMDLETHERQVLDEGFRVCSPAIRGRYVVWVSGEYSIKLYDIETGAERVVVTRGGSGVWGPGVNDKVVVWLHGGDDVTVAPVELGGPDRSGQGGGAAPATVTIGPAVGGGTIAGPFLYWHVRRAGGGVITKYIDFSEGK